MLQTVVNADGQLPDGGISIFPPPGCTFTAGCQGGPAFDPPPSFVEVFNPPLMVTTVPAQTTVMDPPMMAPTILSVIFAVAVIKALILGKSGKTPIKLSNLYIPRELIAFVKLLSQDLTEDEINIFG